MKLSNNIPSEEIMYNQQFNDQIRRIVLTGAVSDQMSDYFINSLTVLEYTDVSTPINVYINSPGGGVDSALAILDAMTTCSCPVRTVGIGMVASAAVILLAAGEKGNRVIAPNCRVMIHQASTMIGGHTAELQNEIEEVHRIQDIYNEILSKYTGKSIKQIEKDMQLDYYMGAEEAIKYGIVDRILPVRKAAKSPLSKAKGKK